MRRRRHRLRVVGLRDGLSRVHGCQVGDGLRGDHVETGRRDGEDARGSYELGLLQLVILLDLQSPGDLGLQDVRADLVGSDEGVPEGRENEGPGDTDGGERHEDACLPPVGASDEVSAIEDIQLGSGGLRSFRTVASGVAGARCH